jgi:hypothetical protein
LARWTDTPVGWCVVCASKGKLQKLNAERKRKAGTVAAGSCSKSSANDGSREQDQQQGGSKKANQIILKSNTKKTIIITNKGTIKKTFDLTTTKGNRNYNNEVRIYLEYGKTPGFPSYIEHHSEEGTLEIEKVGEKIRKMSNHSPILVKLAAAYLKTTGEHHGDIRTHNAVVSNNKYSLIDFENSKVKSEKTCSPASNCGCWAKTAAKIGVGRFATWI